MKTKLLMAFALFLCYLCCYSAYAQDKYDAVYDKIAKETCECAEKDKELNKLLEASDLTGVQLRLASCMLPSAEKYEKSLPEKYKDLTLGTHGKEFGETIGVKLASHCPKLLMKLGTLYNESHHSEIQKSKELTAEVESVTPISTEYMLVFHVKETDGTAHTLLWENKPEGPDELISRPETLKGKTIKFDYVLQDVYSAKTQSYVKVKKITGVATE